MRAKINFKTALCVTLITISCSLALAQDVKPEPAKPPAETPAEKPKETPPPKPKPEPASLMEKQVQSLIESLPSSDPVITEESRRELLEIGRPAVPYLLKALETAKPDLRYTIVEILCDLRDERAVNHLIKLLADRDEYTASIASMAARALGRIGSNVAIPPLMKVITSTDVELRYESIRALGLLRAQDALPLIREAVSDTAQTFMNYFIRATAIQALGRLKDAASVKTLIPLLKNTDIEPATEEPIVKYVIKSLEYITDFKTGNISHRTDPKKKEEIIKAWEDWWEKNKQNYE
jgi:HEAT repeat protein